MSENRSGVFMDVRHPFPYWILGAFGAGINVGAWVFLGHHWWSLASAVFTAVIGIFTFVVWLGMLRTAAEIRASDVRLAELEAEWRRLTGDA